MSIIGWLVLGLISGIVAGKTLGGGEEGGVVRDGALGIAGAIMGGFIFCHSFEGVGVDAFNFYSMLVSIGGAVAVLFAYRFSFRRPNT
jgi:uncharacterized membrane protein YeaQ/YmgE (transglycosylase-associated protein family)